MPTYRNKLATVEAFRLGQRGQPTPAPGWFGSPPPDHVTDDGIVVYTPGGKTLARWGDYVYRRPSGDVYVRSPASFELEYELDDAAAVGTPLEGVSRGRESERAPGAPGRDVREFLRGNWHFLLMLLAADAGLCVRHVREHYWVVLLVLLAVSYFGLMFRGEERK